MMRVLSKVRTHHEGDMCATSVPSDHCAPPPRLQYDSHKRADYNHRAEQLDSAATTVYIPRMSKMDYNERALDVARLQQPHHISRCEFPVHSALEGKPRWDPATGHGGDSASIEKHEREVLERQRVECFEYSKRHPPKNRTETLVQREERFLQEQRAAKMTMRTSTAVPGSMSTTGFLNAGNTVGSAGSFRFEQTGMLAEEAADILSHQVPVKKQTTWSLGGF